VVTDANIIINFLHIERLDILGSRLGSLRGLRFAIPDHVVDEITRERQASALARVMNEGLLDRLEITDLDEIQTLAGLLDRLGSGEAACLAIAMHRGFMLASDEKGYFRRIAIDRIGEERILGTAEIIIEAIRADVVGVAEADGWIAVLAKNRFVLPFDSFGGKV